MNKKVIKDTIILTVITLVSGLMLGFVFMITKEPIHRQEVLEKQRACEAVFTQAASFDNEHLIDVSKASDVLKGQYAECTIVEAIKALDSYGDCIGYVITVTTAEGYSGDITLLIGIQMNGTLNGIEFLEISETPGLGLNVTEDSFSNQFKNKRVERFVLKQDAVNSIGEVQAITSATISSNAVTKAVNAGLNFFHFMKTQGGSVNE